jgi:hypothetical protein
MQNRYAIHHLVMQLLFVNFTHTNYFNLLFTLNILHIKLLVKCLNNQLNFIQILRLRIF